MALLRRLFRELQLQRRLSVFRVEGRTADFTTNRRRVRCGVDLPYRERRQLMTARRSMVSTWQSPSIRPGQWEKGIGRLPLTSINVPTINRLKPWAQSSPVRPADQWRNWHRYSVTTSG